MQFAIKLCLRSILCSNNQCHTEIDQALHSYTTVFLFGGRAVQPLLWQTAALFDFPENYFSLVHACLQDVVFKSKSTFFKHKNETGGCKLHKMLNAVIYFSEKLHLTCLTLCLKHMLRVYWQEYCLINWLMEICAVKQNFLPKRCLGIETNLHSYLMKTEINSPDSICTYPLFLAMLNPHCHLFPSQGLNG